MRAGRNVRGFCCPRGPSLSAGSGGAADAAGLLEVDGTYRRVGGNVESNGLAQAEDVAAVLDHLATPPEADVARTIVLGQSHGGLTTLASGTLNRPGVLRLVNFAGRAGWLPEFDRFAAGLGLMPDKSAASPASSAPADSAAK
jgi:dienelactone hydrolase